MPYAQGPEAGSEGRLTPSELLLRGSVGQKLAPGRKRFSGRAQLHSPRDFSDKQRRTLRVEAQDVWILVDGTHLVTRLGAGQRHRLLR